MGKKNNKYYGDEMYNQDRNNMIADSLENYVDTVENLCILEGKNEEDVNKAIKHVNKAIKNLRNGHPEKVFDSERFYDYIYDHNIEY